MKTTALLLVSAFALLLPIPAEGQQAGAQATSAELVRRIEAHVDSLAALGEFSGVVLLAQDGRPLLEKAVGYADRDARRPNAATTSFNLGSINKLFTQISIRQLEARGLLHPDSTLATYWPDYPNAEVARRVTIRQLLQHRSGVGGNIFAAPAGGTRADLRHNDDFLPLFVDLPLEFEPGSQQRYSNAGYVVLGALVQRLSGVDYYEYVRRNILEPAGMTETTYWPSDSLPQHVAIGYTRRVEGSSGPTANTSLLPGRGSAAGGGYSTAGDLLRLLNALREGRVPSGPPAGIGIAGGAGGLNAALDGDLPGGYDLIVLANLDPPAAERLSQTVRGWLGAD